ncbi:adenosine deaminase [Pseudogulbenkiania sp. MAI-1]|uniref:adenosine deaminase n=1 Tax=Pseudogulbenkiania sp. MAI-1 TaxID=990370 RepID=UPI00045E7CA8|nr:adenosine deaminase [Pseudogulbenkiania sp. MAI-1]
MASQDVDDLIRRLPKTELHLHIEGTLEPEMMFSLAQRNGVTLPYASVEAVRAAYDFSNLQSFLDLYYAGAGVLQTRQDFYDLTRAYLQRAHADNVVHVEIFFDPQTHTARGIPFVTVLDGIRDALDEARAEWGMSSRLILSFLRHLSEDEGFATLAEALPYLDRIDGFGLDSSELGHPPSKFAMLFARCHELGLPCVAHAGEEGPPDYVWEALELLKVCRIDHGVRSLEDPALVKRLAEIGMPLTVCPLSNVRLKVVGELAEHNLRRLLEAGLKAMVNSDDPAYFGGYLNDNLLACRQALELSADEVVTLVNNSFEASWLPEADKQRWLAEVARIHAEWMAA